MKENPVEALGAAARALRLSGFDREELDRRLELAGIRSVEAETAAATARGANEIVRAIASTGELCLALEAAAAAWEAAASLLVALASDYAREAGHMRRELARVMYEAGACGIVSGRVLIEPLDPAPSVEITGPVPPHYLRPVVAPPDKQRMMRELRAGIRLEFARLADGPPRVRISAKESA